MLETNGPLYTQSRLCPVDTETNAGLEQKMLGLMNLKMSLLNLNSATTSSSKKQENAIEMSPSKIQKTDPNAPLPLRLKSEKKLS